MKANFSRRYNTSGNRPAMASRSTYFSVFPLIRNSGGTCTATAARW